MKRDLNFSAEDADLTLLRMKQVRARTGLSPGTIYRYMQERRFPAAVRLGASNVAWVKSEIDDFIRQRIAERDSST